MILYYMLTLLRRDEVPELLVPLLCVEDGQVSPLGLAGGLGLLVGVAAPGVDEEAGDLVGDALAEGHVQVGAGQAGGRRFWKLRDLKAVK